MRDRIFIDTNILVYSLLENNSQKHNQTVHLMESLKGNFIFVSTQVLNELYVSLQKHNIDEIENKIRKKYAYSYWDSLILASALENTCSILYTEDMQNG
jgi:predicted nucleic acid-binding protein